MRTYIILLLFACTLLAKGPLDIEMIEKEPLKLITYGERSTLLVGTLAVTLTNRSDSAVSLLLWKNSHNVLFSSSKRSGVLVHSCDVVGYAKRPRLFPGVMKLIVEAGRDTTILYDTWDCDSPFSSEELPDFYGGGEYSLQFRIHPYRVALERGSRLDLRGKKIPEIISAWSTLLHSKEYWRDAYKSNVLSVRLKPKRK